MAERSVAPITIDDLARLAELARADRDRLFARHRLLGQRYAERVLCAALCQGAALHYVDGGSGVKDFDLWTFYAAHPDGPSPPGGWPGPTSALQVRAPAQRPPALRRPAGRPDRQVAAGGA